MNVAGRHIVVTGGASGIGRAFVERLRRREARVWVLDRDEEQLAELRAALGEVDFPRLVPCDVGRPEQVERAVGEIAEVAGGIDVLVNNAGVLRDRKSVV